MWTRESGVAAAVGLPGTLVACAALAVAAAGAAGYHPLWTAGPLTLSEAAALRDLGEMARLLADGADPDAASAVRPGIVADFEGPMRPLDAALSARRVDSFLLLLQAGAAIPPHDWRLLRCRAERLDAPEIARLLLELQPDLAAGACAPP
jgi:hypothetical protein